MLRSDPLTQGPKIFAASCASCHRFEGHDGLGVVLDDDPSASDLSGFGSRAWLEGLLDPERVDSDAYFGATEHARGRMVRFVTRGIAQLDAAGRDDLSRVVRAVSAEAGLPYQAEADSTEAHLIEEGRALIGSDGVDCTRCHTFRDSVGDDDVPVLTGWGSREWMLGMLHDPSAGHYYGERNDGMPLFGVDEILTEEQMGLVVDWLRRDWYAPGEGG